MKKVIKTLALITATIGVATVVKRKKEQPAGTGHSKVFYGESKPRNIKNYDTWFIRLRYYQRYEVKTNDHVIIALVDEEHLTFIEENNEQIRTIVLNRV